jgi:hypothetical protein
MNSFKDTLRYMGQNYTFVPTYVRKRDPRPIDVKAEEQGVYYSIPSFWRNSTNGNLWMLSAFRYNLAQWNMLASQADEAPIIGIQTDNAQSTPLNGILQMLGSKDTSVTTEGLLNQQVIINTPTVSSFIVGSKGNFSNIPDAIAAAVNSGGNITIFIREGVYFGDIVLTDGISLAAFPSNFVSFQFGVVIRGTLSIGDNTNCTVSGITFITNGSPAINLDVSGSVLNLNECVISAQNFVPITLTNNSTLVCELCNGDLSGTGTHFFSATSSTIRFLNCRMTNSTHQIGANILNSSNGEFSYTYFQSPITTSNTAQLLVRYSTFPTGGSINQTCITAGGSGAHRLFFSFFDGGSSSALIINNTTIVRNCSISSTINSAIAGSGTIQYTPLTFSYNTASITTTTQTTLGSIGPIITLNSITAGSGSATQLMCGSGSPNGTIIANKSSIYFNTTATTTTDRMWINTDGATTWTYFTTAL